MLRPVIGGRIKIMEQIRETNNMLNEVAARIRELREICGYSEEQMAKETDLSIDVYRTYESGTVDLPFSFIHKCSLAFDVGISDLMEGHSAKLSSYTVTRKGNGRITARENGIEIRNLAVQFRNKIAEPYWVTYSYMPELQDKPLHLDTHGGQEFDIIISGRLKVQVGEHVEYLSEGDCIYYDSSTPHGMVAVDGRDCVFCAIVLPGEETDDKRNLAETILGAKRPEPLIAGKFIDVVEDKYGSLQEISFKNEDKFNFAFDIVDALGSAKPDKLAMLHLDRYKTERRFTFKDISRNSSRAANYFKSLGIEKGDRVMLVMRRTYQFWFAVIGLHKLGAIVIPATDQLQKHDFEYRFNAAGVSAIICTAEGNAAAEVDLTLQTYPEEILRIIVNGKREGWHAFDDEYIMYSSIFNRTADSPCGDDTMLMFFTSGTTGYPKIAAHSFKYGLSHYVTARYWHCVEPDGLHLTISETGWGKALWGKLYGQWLCEGAVFVYDFERFNADDILPLFAKYNITTFCAPPTMYRMMIKEDLSRFDLSSIKHATTAGEALNPEVFLQFRKATGLSVMEGFGQTETALVVANLVGMTPKIGSMGKPNPQYEVDIFTSENTPAKVGETGEIVIRTKAGVPVGLYQGYYRDEDATSAAWHDGYYHTGDTAWRDEDGFFWYVGRVDDLIKSSGYRIGPFEIENVIMELPYVLECGVTGVPDPVRGQVVKASVVLIKGTAPTDKLRKEIQTYVKQRTAPYKYPRIVEFYDELPKTISGKIIRNKLR